MFSTSHKAGFLHPVRQMIFSLSFSVLGLPSTGAVVETSNGVSDTCCLFSTSVVSWGFEQVRLCGQEHVVYCPRTVFYLQSKWQLHSEPLSDVTALQPGMCVRIIGICQMPSMS